MKPPMPFGRHEVDMLATALGAVLSEANTAEVMTALAAEEQQHYDDVLLPRMKVYLQNQQSLYQS